MTTHNPVLISSPTETLKRLLQVVSFSLQVDDKATIFDMHAPVVVPKIFHDTDSYAAIREL